MQNQVMDGTNRKLKRRTIEIGEFISPSREPKRRSMPVIVSDSPTKVKSKKRIAVAPDSPSWHKKRTSKSLVDLAPESQMNRNSKRRHSNASNLSKSSYMSSFDPPNKSVPRSRVDVAPESQMSRNSKRRHSNAIASSRTFAIAEPEESVSRSRVDLAPESPLDSSSTRRHSNATASSRTFAIAEPETQSQINTLTDGTPPVFNAHASYMPKLKSQKLSGRLSTLFEIQARRVKATKKVKVDPKKVIFICGINRFSDANYEYMVRVNGGDINLSELRVPVRLNVQMDVRSMSSFNRPVIIGEASYHVESQDSVTAMSARRDSPNF